MAIHPMTYSIAAIVAGILILIFPEILNYVIAIYLILVGIAGLIGSKMM